MRSRHLRLLAFVAASCGVLLPAAAEGLRPTGYFVQGGAGEGRTWNAGVGLTWPWSWRASWLGGEFGGLTEAYISHWDARAATGGRRGFTQVGVVPVLRMRFAGGRSDWFVEAGIGLSAMDQRFVTPDKQFSTSFNFVDIVGVGRSFGADRRQELSLRLQHVSNAGIRNPNPGQNFVQLRYGASF
jgi:lipid A 3-O-deacylase